MKLGLSICPQLSVKAAYRGFLNTEAGARRYDEFKQILYTQADSLAQTLNNSILQFVPIISKDVLRVCDIGGGNGKRIMKILGFLHEKFALRFQLDFVEQSACCMKAFNSAEISSYTDLRCFESLFEAADLPPGEYDLVLLVHSIFAFETEELIEKVLSLRSSRGVIVIVSNAANSFLAGLKSLLDQCYSDGRFEIGDLKACLDKFGVCYEEVPFRTRWASRNENLEGDLATILDWLSLGSFASFSPQLAEAVRNYVREHSVALGERTLFTEDEVTLVIPGQERR